MRLCVENPDGFKRRNVCLFLVAMDLGADMFAYSSQQQMLVTATDAQGRLRQAGLCGGQLSRTGPSCKLGRKVVEDISCQASWAGILSVKFGCANCAVLAGHIPYRTIGVVGLQIKTMVLVGMRD